jgi:PhnB protein
MKINPYLIFNGDCKAAFTFYAQCLQGHIEAMMTFGETPAAEHVPKEHHDLIIHTCLKVGDQMLMASDTTPDRPTPGMSGCSISLNVDSITEAERVFNALAEGGKVEMPLDATFWAARFGMLVDRFGVSWMVNCEKDQS